MQKIYAYADENGQDTMGRVFIVGVVVLVDSQHKEVLSSACEAFEVASGKGKAKWGKSRPRKRLDYLRRVLADPRFRGKLRYSVFEHGKDYDLATIMAIAKAIHWSKLHDFTSLVYVDGLSKTKRPEYAQQLRRLGIPTQKVRGVMKDENDALIRLADTLAGFIRDALDKGTGEEHAIYTRARRKGILVEV